MEGCDCVECVGCDEPLVGEVGCDVYDVESAGGVDEMGCFFIPSRALISA